MENSSERFYGSICLTDLIKKAKEGHPAFSKADNGKTYVAINVWRNFEPDKYGNVLSLKLQAKKDSSEVDKKFYIGNCKLGAPVDKPLSDADRESLEEPEVTNVSGGNSEESSTKIEDDQPLPF